MAHYFGFAAQASKKFPQKIDEDRRPGHGEVRIRLIAARLESPPGFEAGDRRALPRRYPRFVEGQVLGVVEKAGAHTPNDLKGRTVVATIQEGRFMRRMCIPYDLAVRVPKKVEPAEALFAAAAYLPAFQLLERKVEPGHGDRILLRHGGCAVGGALQTLAHEMGVDLFQSRSRSVDSRAPDALEQVLTRLRKAHPAGAHAFIDLSGRWRLGPLLSALRRDGDGFVLVRHVPRRTLIPFFWLNVLRTAFYHLTRQRHVEHYSPHHDAWTFPERYRKDLHRLLHKVKDGKLPVPAHDPIPLHAEEEIVRALTVGRAFVLVP